MILNLSYQKFSPNLFVDIEQFARSSSADIGVVKIVSDILKDVKENADQALIARTLLYDKVELSKSDLQVSLSEMETAANSLLNEQKQAINEAVENVSIFHQQNLPKDWTSKNLHGATIGESYYPIKRVGLYVPGGNVPLVSTVIMTAALAKVAGVSEIAVTTPPNKDGSITPELLAALNILGIKEVYKVGGAQAIGALAYGTETISPVDKIYGPGNAFVNEAKRQVFGIAGIDLLPGPSEVMVIADNTANPAFTAAALIAQAEHGSGKEKIYLIFTNEDSFDLIKSAIQEQLHGLSHKQAILEIFNVGFFAVHTNDLNKVAEVANFIAPEHLELQVDRESISFLQKNITTAGALLLGHYSATALGDFVAGPSHVLPTGRSSRFSSGLRIEDFFRRTSIIQYDRQSVERAKSSAMVFSKMERLDGHGNSVAIRLNRTQQDD